MKRPSLQFYTGDWLSDSKLRRAGFHLKGVWIDLLCLFHDNEEYGILRWPLEEIAQTIGCKKKDLSRLIELGILKGSEKDGEKVSFSILVSQRNETPREEILIKNQEIPLYFSSRMVRDEYIRKMRAKHGIKSLNNPKVPRPYEKEKDTFSIEETGSFSIEETGSFSPSPSSSSSKEQKKTKNSTPTKKRGVPNFPLPPEIPLEAWDAWMEIRRHKRATNSDFAKNLLCKKLQTISIKSGRSIQSLIEQAIERNWISIEEDWIMKASSDSGHSTVMKHGDRCGCGECLQKRWG